MKRLDQFCRRTGETTGPRLRKAVCEAGVGIYGVRRKAMLRLRRLKAGSPLVARHGWGAALGVARLTQLCTSMGAPGALEAAGAAAEADRYAENVAREMLLEACKDDATMTRRLQRADTLCLMVTVERKTAISRASSKKQPLATLLFFCRSNRPSLGVVDVVGGALLQ